MSAEYSVEEVRNAARLLDGLSRRMLNDYAERIKADESAVTAEVVQKAVQAFATSLLQQREEGGSGHHKDMRAALLAVWPNPPAQAAQVDAWKIICQSIAKLQFSDEYRRGRLTVDVEALLHEINTRRDSESVAQHPDDAAVDAFADAMKAKLAEARAKGRGGWQDKADCPQQRLSDMLRAHVEKGDPRDVANFCMFLHQRDEAISPAEPVAQGGMSLFTGTIGGVHVGLHGSKESIEALDAFLAAQPRDKE